jgi:hypothetical protein
MKEFILNTTFLCLFIFVTSCSQKEKLPPPVTSVEQAKTLTAGKTWKVVDVATISGSVESIFDKDKSKKEPISVPSVESLNWLSTNKETENNSDFENSFYNDSRKISMALNKDSVAITTGLDAKEQIFSINNERDENKPDGIKLTLTGESKSFGSMGAGKFTATYYILGANEKKLYLLTPNKLNGSKVVFLLETK